MSEEFSDIAAYASERAAVQVQQQAQVSILKKQNDNAENVVTTLLQGLSATPRAPEQTGHHVNIVA